MESQATNLELKIQYEEHDGVVLDETFDTEMIMDSRDISRDIHMDRMSNIFIENKDREIEDLDDKLVQAEQRIRYLENESCCGNGVCEDIAVLKEELHQADELVIKLHSDIKHTAIGYKMEIKRLEEGYMKLKEECDKQTHLAKNAEAYKELIKSMLDY